MQISILNEEENLNPGLPTLVSKSLVSFASLPRQIMTSIVIQFVRLVALFTSIELKSSELQHKGYLLKKILLSWLFKALWG